MSLPHASRLGFAVLCVSLMGAQTSCTDLPTGADSFQLEADGQLWVAVLPPEGLPDAATWLAYTSPGAAPFALRAEIAEIEEQARRARVSGDAERADALLTGALRRSVEAMAVDPGRGFFAERRAALDSWRRSVQAGVEIDRAPALRATLEAVERDGAAVDAALEAGDYRAAAMRLTVAAERIRRWSPDGVAAQVLERVETHLAAAARTPQELERTAHLVDGARQELLGGNPLRAMQRALYALQLAGGSELHEIPVLERSRCGEYAC
jgi:hypothetical protein